MKKLWGHVTIHMQLTCVPRRSEVKINIHLLNQYLVTVY
jgi:hypothetical protein